MYHSLCILWWFSIMISFSIKLLLSCGLNTFYFRNYLQETNAEILSNCSNQRYVNRFYMLESKMNESFARLKNISRTYIWNCFFSDNNLLFFISNLFLKYCSIKEKMSNGGCKISAKVNAWEVESANRVQIRTKSVTFTSALILSEKLMNSSVLPSNT